MYPWQPVSGFHSQHHHTDHWNRSVEIDLSTPYQKKERRGGGGGRGKKLIGTRQLKHKTPHLILCKIRGPARGGSHVARLNFKTSCVGVYKWLLLIVGFAAEGGCLLSRFHFTRCRYFLGHVACRNLPWQGLKKPSNLIPVKSSSPSTLIPGLPPLSHYNWDHWPAWFQV